MEVTNMKKYKFFLCLLIALLLLQPVQVLAAGMIDLEKDVTFTISYQDGKLPLSGAQFKLYHVADVDETGEITVTDSFSRFNVDIRGKNDNAWRTIASTLEGYVLNGSAAPDDSGKTDDNGMISFPSAGKKLAKGLYLVVGTRHEQYGNYYDATPFMVMLPSQDNSNTWSYEISSSPKHTTNQIPTKPETVTRKVLKVWKDGGATQQRPKEITVQLLQNGNVYSTVKLNAGNNWRYEWSNLDSKYKWTVIEKTPSEYTVSITQEGITFVITNSTSNNSQPGKPSEPSLPQTGQLWWPVPVLFCVGLAFISAGLIRRRGTKNEK